MLVNILQNTISSFRSASSAIITNGLKMWLGFKTSSISGANQITPDLSGNSNVGKLFTGKALDFNGVSDYVDIGSQSTEGSEITVGAWINLNDLVGNKSILSYGDFLLRTDDADIMCFGDVSVSFARFSDVLTTDSTRIVVTIAGTSVSLYLNGTLIDTKSISALSSDSSASYIGKYTSTWFFDGLISNLQIYNSAWTQDDATFDYNNPNHLVTDNPNSTLTLSNLSAYYALSEGSGSIAYDSATSLGSEEVVNGDFSNNFTSWTNGSDWSIVSSAAHLTNSDSATNSTLTSDTSLTSTLSYKATYTISDYVSGELALVVGNVSIPSTNGTHTIILSGLSSFSVKRKGGATDLTLDNVSIKLVSVGDITGATYDDQQPTIPQLGLMDWAKSTIGSDEVTLIQAPNNKGFDILGNPLRLREHSFNLDGSGYAEVDDDNSLDFGTGAFSCDGWVKFIYVNAGVGINCIYSNGGQIDVANTFGIGVTSNKLVSRVSSTELNSTTTFSAGEWVYFALTRDGSGACKFYINDNITPEATASQSADLTNSLSKLIGRDSSNVRYYQDLIDDIRVYDKELSSEEILNNYNVGLPAHKSGSSYSDDYSSDYGF